MTTVQSQLDLNLPTRQVKIHSADRPWMTAQVKSMINDRQRAFKKGDNLRWRYLRNKVGRCIEKAKKDYYNTRVSRLKNSNPSAWYRQIKILTQGNTAPPSITIPGSDGNNVDPKEVANAINNHFILIASDLPPLDRNNLPAFLPSPNDCPEVLRWEVYTQLCKLKLQKAGTTNDLPVRIIKEFAYELSEPLTYIINTSFKQGKVPTQWKRSQVTPIPKSQPPTIDNLRPIALTSYFAKICESFAAKWLLEDIRKSIDPQQFGNQPGLSTTHYLINLLDQLFKHCEKSKSAATILCTDFTKAFDKLDHNILISKLVKLNVRPWLIDWIASFLENRKQCVKYFGTLSEYNLNHAGVPQGTKLGPLLFLVMINDALCDITIPYYKYVDDLTLLECRTDCQESQLQCYLSKLNQWSHKNNMKLNPSKCLAMNVSFSRNQQLPGTYCIDNTQLPWVSSAKILGVIIQSNLKWDGHVSEIRKKCNRKLYMFRSIKQHGLSVDDLKTVYIGYIRPVLEYCAPVFNSGLTMCQRKCLEQIQKRVF